MRGLALGQPGKPLKVLCLGAHSDDIEIGCAGTLLGLIERGVKLDVHWCVLSAPGARAAEAQGAAADVLAGAERAKTDFGTFRDGFFPYQGAEIKAYFEALKGQIQPDVIFTHRRDDLHQDHREVCKLTWNSFRDQTILEYEIPKWDGDLGRPNVFMPMSAAALNRKIEILMRNFGTQRSKDWFDGETFRGLARIRGMECRAPERYAEAFHARKLLLA